VQRIFYPFDSAAILSMPRPRTEQLDFWAWEWEKSGSFSVRSAYLEIILKDGLLEPTGSLLDGDESTWKAFWGLRVMPKFRVFWWRVVKNLPPCTSELHRRQKKFVAVHYVDIIIRPCTTL
jgi:hypothetical protein